MSDTAPYAAASDKTNGNGSQTRNDERLLRLVDELEAARARAGLKAFALAPSLDIYHALMRGERVPVEQLNPDAVIRYGIRR